MKKNNNCRTVRLLIVWLAANEKLISHCLLAEYNDLQGTHTVILFKLDPTLDRAGCSFYFHVVDLFYKQSFVKDSKDNNEEFLSQCYLFRRSNEAVLSSGLLVWSHLYQFLRNPL